MRHSHRYWPVCPDMRISFGRKASTPDVASGHRSRTAPTVFRLSLNVCPSPRTRSEMPSKDSQVQVEPPRARAAEPAALHAQRAGPHRPACCGRHRQAAVTHAVRHHLPWADSI